MLFVNYVVYSSYAVTYRMMQGTHYGNVFSDYRAQSYFMPCKKATSNYVVKPGHEQKKVESFFPLVFVISGLVILNSPIFVNIPGNKSCVNFI